MTELSLVPAKQNGEVIWYDFQQEAFDSCWLSYFLIWNMELVTPQSMIMLCLSLG